MSHDINLNWVPWARVKLVWNPRSLSTISAESIEEMAASILEHQICQPVLGRLGADGETVEVYVGQRRILGFEQARKRHFEGGEPTEMDLEHVPVLVREIDDRTMLAHQLIENLQREGVHPKDEAAGYVMMRDKIGYTVADISRKMGKSAAYVVERMALLKIPDFLWRAYDEGRVTISHLEIVGSVPSKTSREEFGKLVLGGKYGDGVLTVKMTQEVKNNRFVVSLNVCGFDKKDPDLVAVEMDGNERLMGGACGDCPHKSGQGAGAMCSNIACYQMKQDATWRLVKANAERCGKRYMDCDVTSRMFEDFGALLLRESTGLVDLGGKPRHDDTGHFSEDVPTWGELLPKDSAVWSQAISARHPKTNRVHQIIERETAIRAALEADPVVAGGVFEWWVGKHGKTQDLETQDTRPEDEGDGETMGQSEGETEELRVEDEVEDLGDVSAEVSGFEEKSTRDRGQRAEKLGKLWRVLGGVDLADERREFAIMALVGKTLDVMPDAALEPAVAAFTGVDLEWVGQWDKQTLVDNLMDGDVTVVLHKMVLAMYALAMVRGEMTEEMEEAVGMVETQDLETQDTRPDGETEGVRADLPELPTAAVVERDASGKKGGKEAEERALGVYLETGSIAKAAEAVGMGVESVKNWHKRRGWKALREAKTQDL